MYTLHKHPVTDEFHLYYALSTHRGIDFQMYYGIGRSSETALKDLRDNMGGEFDYVLQDSERGNGGTRPEAQADESQVHCEEN